MKNYTTKDAIIALEVMLKSYCDRCGYELVISNAPYPDDSCIRYDIRCRDLGVGHTQHVYTRNLEQKDLHLILTDLINKAEKAFDEAARTKGRGGYGGYVYLSSADHRKAVIDTDVAHMWPKINSFLATAKGEQAYIKYGEMDVKFTKAMQKFFDPDKTPEIKDVIFQDPATIVLWADGTKTVVRAQDEEYDPEKGLAMAICKKVGGNKWSYFNKFKHWLKKIKPTTGDFEQVSHVTKVIKED